jgi:hypothetical protein
VSHYTHLAIMAGTSTDQLLPAVQRWADAHDRAADFATLDSPRMASDAGVIVGCVNHLGGLEDLKAAIRDAVWDDRWKTVPDFGVGLMVRYSDDFLPPEFHLLDEKGEWRP